MYLRAHFITKRQQGDELLQKALLARYGKQTGSRYIQGSDFVRRRLRGIALDGNFEVVVQESDWAVIFCPEAISIFYPAIRCGNYISRKKL
jgi:hypothetical protein